jgi:prevent-host-death family protein
MNSVTEPVSSTDIQRHFGTIMYQIMRHRIPIIVTHRNREEMAIIPIDRYEELLENEKDAARLRGELLRVAGR